LNRLTKEIKKAIIRWKLTLPKTEPGCTIVDEKVKMLAAYLSLAFPGTGITRGLVKTWVSNHRWITVRLFDIKN